MGKKRNSVSEGILYDDFWTAAQELSKNPNKAYGKGRIEASQAPVFRGYNTGYGESKYDENLNWDAEIGDNIQADITEHRAQNQSWGAKASAGIARAGVKAGIEIAKLAPTVAGIVSAPFAAEGEGWETAFNNTGHQSLNALNEYINDEALPVYVKESVKNGNLWDALTSIDFYATDGADGLGFMLSMFAPGAALKALGGANKFKNIIGGFERGRSLMSKAAGVGLKADEVGITLANTFAEAAAESGSQMEAMNQSKPEYFKTYLAQIDNDRRTGKISVEEANAQSTNEALELKFNQQKGAVGKDSFWLNMGLLAGTNFVNTKMLGLAGESSIKKVGSQALRDNEGNIVKSIATRTLGNRLKDAPGKAGTMLLNEGFVEEGTQSTIENYLSGEAKKGKLTGNTFKDFDLGEFGEEYVNMLTTTEGQKAIALGGILGYGSVAVRSAKQLVTGKGTDEDSEIARVNSLLTKGAEAQSYLAEVNPDVFKRTEEIDPITGENNFALVNGKKIVDPVKRDNLFINAKIVEEDGKIWDEALKNNDIQTIEYLQNIAEARLINSFIADSQDGINILSEYLKDSAIPEDRKKSIIKKATALQKSHEEFISYSEPVLNLKNQDASNEDLNEFHQKLIDINKVNTFDQLVATENLEKINNSVNNLLSQHGLTRDSLENEKLKSVLSETDMRFKKELELEGYYKSKLEDVRKTNLDLWNPKKQQELFNELVKSNKTTRDNNSEQNVANADKIADDIANAQTVTSTNEAVANVNNVDNQTAEVLTQLAEDKKKTIITKTETDIIKGNESVKEEVNDTVNEPEGVIIDDETGEVYDYENDKHYSNIDEYNKANGIETSEDLPVDTSINKLDEEDVTDISNETIPEDIVIPTTVTDSEGSSFPTAATMGINTNYKDESNNIIYTWSTHVSDAFKALINNFKSIIGTPITFSIPTYLTPNNQKALDLLNLKKNSYEDFELNILHQYLPLQLNVDINTYTFIAPSENNSKGSLTDSEFRNTPQYKARKNIVDAIVLNKGYEGITSKISYQKGGTLVYDKTGDTENNITSLKEFETNKPSLFFVKDIDGNIYNESGQQAELLKEFPFNLKNPHTQKGYVYTVIHSPGGIATPIKLNVRKINQSQAEMIYRIYNTLYNYNQDPNNVKLSQSNAKLTDLYDIDSTLKTLIETNFTKELGLFKSQKNITVGDFMTLFIHDNVNYDGTTKPYTTKYQGGQLLTGQEGLLTFDETSPITEEEFINFLTTKKRQNTKLSYLAGENSNVDKTKYKDYLLNDITSVNIDTQQPFKGDINVYIDTNIKTSKVSNKTTLENNSQNTLNSETNNVSSSDNSFKTEAITSQGLSQLKSLKKKPKLDNNAPKKC